MPADPPRRTIRCPHCGQEISLDEAIAHELAAPLRARWEKETREKVEAEARASQDRQLAELSAKSAELEEALTERDSKIKELQGQEAHLRKEKQKLDDEKDAWDLERLRMRDEIAKEERDKAVRLAAERGRLEFQQKEEELQEQSRRLQEQSQTKIAQLEAQLQRAQKESAELQRKLQAGSHTEAGYARQEVFTEELQDAFPDDRITPVSRGKAGADVTQVVRHRAAERGTILWEVKRAAKWQPGWIAKLAAERDRAGALIGVIVSEALPVDLDGFGQIGDVWVCSFRDAVPLAGVLREMVITAWRHTVAAAERAGHADKVYNYVMTGNFSRRFESLGRIAAGLMQDLEQDRRALDQRWKRTERRIREIFEVRDAIPGDLLDAIGAEAELPAALRAELPPADAVAELPPIPKQVALESSAMDGK